MIINLLVVGFVLMMAYYWYTQGFFSAFLHLALVIAAGVLAFALWEPTAHWLLGSARAVSHYAWGIALIGWFIIILTVLRVVMDRYVPGNMQFQNVFNLVGGGLCGLASGVLTAGVMVIGVGFLPMPMSLGGYQPFNVGPDNRLQSTGDQLWVPADRMAANFFTRLSGGAFSPWGSNASLATHRPEVAAQAAMFRLRYDEHASIVADPDMVEIDRLIEHRLPSDDLPADLVAALGSQVEQTDQQLIVIETNWTNHPAGYDASTVRVGQAQVQLVTRVPDGGAGGRQYHYPVAFSKDDIRTQQRQLYPFISERVVAYTSDEQTRFAFAFVIPADAEPDFALIRQIRYPLGRLAPEGESEALLAALGTPAVADEPADDAVAEDRPERTAEAEGPLEQTNAVPRTFSKNYAPRFNYEGTAIAGGTGNVGQHGGRLTDATRVDSIYEPGHQRMVRLEADIRAARSLLGQIRQAGERVHGIHLEDHRGQRVDPVAYIWVKADGDQEIHVDLDGRIRSATQLPRPASIGSEDTLYLYFLVPPGVTIRQYHLGPNESHEVDFEVQ